MPKLDCFSPEKSKNGLNFIPKFKIRTEFNPKIQNSDQIYPEKSRKIQKWTEFIQKNPKMEGKVIKNYQVISLPRLSTSEPYRMPSSRLSHPLRNRLCDGLLFTNRS